MVGRDSRGTLRSRCGGVGALRVGASWALSELRTPPRGCRCAVPSLPNEPAFVSAPCRGTFPVFQEDEGVEGGTIVHVVGYCPDSEGKKSPGKAGAGGVEGMRQLQKCKTRERRKGDKERGDLYDSTTGRFCAQEREEEARTRMRTWGIARGVRLPIFLSFPFLAKCPSP